MTTIEPLGPEDIAALAIQPTVIEQMFAIEALPVVHVVEIAALPVVIEVRVPGLQGPRGLPGLPGTDSGETITISVQNADTVAITVGTPVRLFSVGQVKRLSAAEPYTCYALVKDPIIPAGGFGLVSADEVLIATEAEWDEITLTSGGLLPGQAYYAATLPGKITPLPSLATIALILIGFAVNATKLRTALDNPTIL